MINPINNNKYSDKYFEIKKKIDKLPASSPKTQKQLIKLLDKFNLILLTAETGAGKSTSIVSQIAKYFKYQKKIICTQPRKLAAKNTADFMSAILDVELGNEVGYQYRGENKSNKNTILKFVTDGLLLMKAFDTKNDTINEYSAIIIDEAHERSVSIDLILYFLKRRLFLQQKNKTKYPEIKIIIMSATIQLDLFKSYFKSIPYGEIHISGRTFPVKSKFLKIKGEYKKNVIKTIQNIITYEPGDVLVFLPTKRDILDLQKDIQKLDNKNAVYALYSGIQHNKQKLIIDKDMYKKQGFNRKIVLSTNVAETSITIDGILYVIDTGYSIQKKYYSNIRGYQIKKDLISQASIKQRIGRAGRTQSGTAYHMYTEDEYNKLEKYTLPEIVIENLFSPYLNILKSFGNTKLVNLVLSQLIQPPSDLLIKDALYSLEKLKLIKNNKITQLGIIISLFPTEPNIGVLIYKGIENNCEDDAMELGAMLSISKTIDNWFVKIKKGNRLIMPDTWHNMKDKSGDHLSLLKMYKKYFNSTDKQQWCSDNHVNYKKIKEVSFMYKKFKRVLYKIKQNNYPSEIEPQEIPEQMGGSIGIMNCIIAGFSYQTATKQKNKLHVSHIIYPVKLNNSNLNLNDIPERCLYTELVESRDIQLNIVSIY